MRTKLIDFSLAVSITDFDLIILTETWLSPDFQNAELGLRNYSIYRKDRDSNTSIKKLGGGVLIAIKNEFDSHMVQTNLNIEATFVLAKIYNEKYLITSVYFPPNSSDITYENYSNEIESIVDNYDEIKLICCGDFNLPGECWNEFLDNVPCVMSRSQFIINNTMSMLDVNQINKIKNVNSTLLDLIFVSHEDVQVFEADEVLVKCDPHHPALRFDIIADKCEIKQNIIYFRDFKTANYDALLASLSNTDWNSIINDNLESSVDAFYNVIFRIINEFVPKRMKGKSYFPNWFSDDLKKLISNKKAAHKKYKQSGNTEDYNNFSTIRNSCKIESQTCYNDYISTIEESIHNNPKFFWKFVNDLKQNKDLPRTMCLDDTVSSDPHEIVEMFKSNFSKIYKPSNPKNVTIEYIHDVDVSDCIFSVEEVMTGLQALSEKNDEPPDCIPSVFLRHCSGELAFPLCKLFNLSMRSGIFPTKWKHNYIIPIFKSGNKNEIKNYRPICKSSYIPKLFDTLIANKISPLFKQVFINEQHGFIPKRSVTTNLLTYSDIIIESMKSGKQVDSIYTDFKKAYDTVAQWLLIAKMKALGIGSPLINWIEDRISGIGLRVVYDGILSKEFLMESGILQGSPLSSLLFLIFINDIGERVKFSLYLLFADDLKIFREISSLDDCKLLQSDLNGINNWCLENEMEFNIGKCQVIRFGRLRSKYIFDYNINQQILKDMTLVKDLGVYFDQKMDFIAHIQHITNKAFKMLGFIKRSMKHFNSLEAIKTVYCTNVRSILEYASVVWSPSYSCHKQTVERVQRKFFKWITFKLRLPLTTENYNQETIDLMSLELRRKNFDIMLIFKVINNFIDCEYLLSRISLNCRPAFLRSREVFHLNFTPTNYTLNNPLTRSQRSANKCQIDLFSSSIFVLKGYFRSQNLSC